MTLSRSCRSISFGSITSSSFILSSSSSHHFASSSSSSSSSSSPSSLSPCRCFSSSSSSHASTSGSMPETRSSRSDSARTSAGNPSSTAAGGRKRQSGARLPPYEQWIKGQGAQLYKSPPPGKGPHWISETPFPLNPSFLPPAPLSQKARDELWNLHSSNPRENGVRQLSMKFSISPARIEAVLRLKALETEWQAQGKPLQTEFTKNMDKLLGSPSLPDSKDSQSTTFTAEISTSPETRESTSPRGSIVEEFPESGSETSVLGPAMLKAQEKQKQRLSDLPTGGPSVKAVKSAESHKKEIRPPAGNGDRPTLVVSNLSVKISKTKSNLEGRPEVRSYQGAGRLARNERRAEKRKLSKERKKGNTSKITPDPTESHTRAEMER